jgi:LuxR family maltose regulon positive regulatory protein
LNFDLRPRPAAPVELAEVRFRPPPLRPGLIERYRLTDRLEASGAPVVCVVAPPGYGKTTLLAQWARLAERPLAWVSIDRRDNDPAVLLASVCQALHRVAVLDPCAVAATSAPGASAFTLMTRLVDALAAMRRPVTLVLDHLEAIHDRNCLDVISELALAAGGNAQLVLASRVRPPLPLARLRTERRLLELGPQDLAMDEAEARAALAAVGSRLAAGDLTGLLRRTEGWPAGLYMAALADEAGASDRTGLAFSGDDRFMAEYLRTELLDRLSPRTVWFLTRTSMLDRMSGPLCDAVLSTTGSGQVLAAMERANLLLIPLDRTGVWYRYHHLFRELLQAELVRRESAAVPRLHARAAAWYRANDLPETALQHAQATGDSDQVADLMSVLVQPAFAAGRSASAERWMTWLEHHGPIERYPKVAVQGVWLRTLMGQPAAAERLMMAAEEGAADLPADHPERGWLALGRALLCRNGVERTIADSRRAQENAGPEVVWPASALVLEGIAHLLSGDTVQADRVLARTVTVATELGALPSASVALGERAVVALGRGDWEQAGDLVDRALEMVSIGGLKDYITSSIVYAVAARVAARRGDAEHARAHLAAAARLRPLMNYAAPLLSVQTLLELVRAYLAVGDAAAAQVVLRQARDLLWIRPDLGILGGEAMELVDQVKAVRAVPAGASALTTAELRLVPLLATHMTFREIGDRLSVSRHTVKAQAISVYRKLGVSSRSDAVECLRESGLIGV